MLHQGPCLMSQQGGMRRDEISSNVEQCTGYCDGGKKLRAEFVCKENEENETVVASIVMKGESGMTNDRS